jgi:hypothetical protein
LLNYRCINIYTVRYVFELDHIYPEFLANSESHYFIEALSELLGVSSDDHYINSITEGSTIINGMISASSWQHAVEIQKAIGKRTLVGSVVISVIAVIYERDEPRMLPEGIVSVDEEIAFFVGVLVGGSVILITLIVVIIKRRNKAQINVQIVNDNHRNMEKEEELGNSQEIEK